MIANSAIRGVIYTEDMQGEVWFIAQLLEHDINAQARTTDELRRALAATVFAEWQAHGQDLSKIEPVPKRFFDMCRSDEDVEFEEEVDGIGVSFSLCTAA